MMFKSIDHLVNSFISLAQDQWYDPDEIDNWRDHTFEGVKEDLEDKNFSANVFIANTIREAELVLNEAGPIMSSINEILSLVRKKNINKKNINNDINYNYILNILNSRNESKIVLMSLAYENTFDYHTNFRFVINLIKHAKNIVKHKDIISEKNISNNKNLYNSYNWWAGRFKYGDLQKYLQELLEKIDNFLYSLRRVKSIIDSLDNLFNFISEKATFKTTKRGKEEIITPYIYFPPGLKNHVPGDDLEKYVNFLVGFYSYMRQNVVEIINYSRDQYKNNFLKDTDLIKNIKKVKNKPKNILPLPENIPAELRSTIFKIYRDRDDAVNEIHKVSGYIKTESIKFFINLYQQMTGKGVVDWYRSFMYKKYSQIDSFMQNFMMLSMSEINGVFNISGPELLTDLVVESGNIQNIFKILKAMYDSDDVLHNFEYFIAVAEDIRQDILEIYRTGKGGVFDFKIIPKYLYVRQSLFDAGLNDHKGSSAFDSIFFNKAIERGLFSKEEFNNTIEEVNKIRLINIDRKDYDVIKKADSFIKSIENIEYIIQYEEDRQDKNPILFELDSSRKFEDKNIEFKVLRDKDPMHFFIGLETDCCQYIGGAGEKAVKDSYINPNAGVIVMYANDDIISQSYFHYVPADHGVILDNVETNESAMRKNTISQKDLDYLYSEFAKDIAQEMKVNYVKCGKEYNALSNKSFEKAKMKKDPRDFVVGEKYTDFDNYDHLDLLQYKGENAEDRNDIYAQINSFVHHFISLGASQNLSSF